MQAPYMEPLQGHNIFMFFLFFSVGGGRQKICGPPNGHSLGTVSSRGTFFQDQSQSQWASKDVP